MLGEPATCLSLHSCGNAAPSDHYTSSVNFPWRPRSLCVRTEALVLFYSFAQEV